LDHQGSDYIESHLVAHLVVNRGVNHDALDCEERGSGRRWEKGEVLLDSIVLSPIPFSSSLVVIQSHSHFIYRLKQPPHFSASKYSYQNIQQTTAIQ